MSLRSFFLSSPLFFGVFLLQEAFVTQLKLPFGGFNLLLIVALIWASLSTPEIGALTGFGAGIGMDLSQTSPVPLGHWTLVMIIGCYAVAFFSYGDDNVRGNPINIIFLTTIGVLLLQVAYLLIAIMLGQEIGSIQHILFILSGTTFWSAIISPLCLKVISYLHANVFGTRNLL
jgi:rod shape-determining protein MreD